MNSRTRVVPCLTLTATLFLNHIASAEITPPKGTGGKCSYDASYQRVSVSEIENMVKRNKPVALAHKVIGGGDVTLNGRSVQYPFRINDSIVLGNVNFVETIFLHDFDLSGTCVNGRVNAQLAHFNGGATWSTAKARSVFLKPISLYASTVNGSLTFDGARFEDQAHFSRARIKDGAYFTRAHFGNLANFIGTVVDYEGVFEGVLFASDAAFERAEFGGSARFRERPVDHQDFIPAAIFKGAANFKATRIGGQANFIGVQFQGEVRMTRSRFDEAYFWKAQFPAGNPSIDGSNDVMFNDAEYGILDFGGNGQSAQFAPARKLNLTGFIYHRSNSPVGYMLNLLARLDKNFNRQPYNHLEKLYRDAGNSEIADQIFYDRKRHEGDKIPASNSLRWSWDRFWRYVFGYGVNRQIPIAWVAGLVILCALILARRGALERTHITASQPDLRPVHERLGVSFLFSIGLLIPKMKLPGTRRWRPRQEAIEIPGLVFPITYKQLASAVKLLAWGIITIYLSLFSIADFVKN